jgi:hypothetical protein
MKQLPLIIVLGLSLIIQAQTPTDALRYSLDDIQGTARFRAMSGAFGALGGDLTAASINPAGSVVFTTNAVSFSTGYFENNQDADYFGQTNSSRYNSFDINQFAGVFVFNNPDISSNWTKFSFGMMYDRTADFDNEWISNGVNPNSSLGTFFFENARGKRFDEISAFPDETISEAYAAIGNLYGYEHQQAFLGYESFILDPVEPIDSNTDYILNVDGDEYAQRYLYSSRGYNGKLAFNFGAQYRDFLQLGVNLNTHFLSYDELTRTDERVIGSRSLVNDIDFQETLYTTGGGFSFQLGAIARVTPSLRLGFNYNSPTWYYLNDNTTQFISTVRTENGGNQTQIVDPLIVNFYPSYKLQTPWSIGASAAYVFGGRALLSFDYGYKDYASMRYSPRSDVFFSEQNQIIANTFKGASTFRAGAEYRIQQVSLRGGYRFEESPYQDTSFFGDLEGYSFGLGYKFGLLRLDASFSQSERDYQYRLFDVGLTDTVQLNQRFTDVILTMTFAF